jgi:hypothetical protein
MALLGWLRSDGLEIKKPFELRDRVAMATHAAIRSRARTRVNRHIQSVRGAQVRRAAAGVAYPSTQVPGKSVLQVVGG